MADAEPCYTDDVPDDITARHGGHPFFVLGWGCDALGMVLDAETDCGEVR